jgi:hypothetical protein
MLVVGAMALLSTAILMMNNSFTDTGKVVLTSKLGINALSVGTSVFEKAIGKDFDEVTTDSNLQIVSALTPSAQLGLDPGETFPDSVDDVDDYNNASFIKTFDQGGTFNVSCKVAYVNATAPGVAVSTPTFHKRITVLVSAPEMRDTVKLEYIMSYWFFR